MSTHTSKTAFLTGASSGIGQALAPELAARGYDLVLAARRIDSLEQVKQDIAARFPQRRVEVRALDVTRYADVQSTIAAAAEENGGLDLIIANAGIGSTSAIGHGNFDADRAVIETNVLGAMATIEAAVALFRRQNRGQIVVISSVAAFRGLPGAGSYSASKADIADLIERGVQTSTVPVYPWNMVGKLLRVLPTGVLVKSAKGAMPGGN